MDTSDSAETPEIQPPRSLLQDAAASKYCPYSVAMRFVDGDELEIARFVQILCTFCPGAELVEHSDVKLAGFKFELIFKEFPDFAKCRE